MVLIYNPSKNNNCWSLRNYLFNCVVFFNSFFSNFSKLDFKLIFKNESSGDIGSSCASTNGSEKTNAKQGPLADYSAYKDFHDREFKAHVVASFLTFAGMKTMEGNYIKILQPCCVYKASETTSIPNQDCGND